MAHPIKHVTNAQVLDVLRNLGFQFPEPFDLTGAQNKEFALRVVTHLRETGQKAPDGVFEQAVKIAKDLVLLDQKNPPPLERLSQTLSIYGVKGEDLHRILDEAVQVHNRRVRTTPGGTISPSGQQFDVGDYAEAAAKILGTDNPVVKAALKVAGVPETPPPTAPPPAAPPPAPAPAPAPAAKPAAPPPAAAPPSVPKPAAPGASPPGPVAPVPKLTPEDEAAIFGWGKWALDDPELGPILRNAALGQWSENRLRNAIYATNWWKNTSATQRDWTNLKNSDPATANEQLQSRVSTIQEMATELGITIDPARARSLAETSIMLGWDQSAIRRAVGSEFHYTPGAQPGQAGLTISQLKKMASDWGVPLSDTTVAQWTGQVLRGDQTVENFTNYLQSQAKVLYPALSQSIDSGVTVKQYADVYGQIASKTLGISQDSIDWTDPKWMRALNQVDPKTGQRTVMNMDDWQRTLRSDPVYGWEYTRDAHQEAAGLTEQLSRMFGMT